MSEAKSVCIIGAGLSGLTCGAKLARAGLAVSIVEENAAAGGMLSVARIGREYLELLPHHLRKSDKALLSLARDMGVNDKIEWFDTTWYGKAAHKKVGYFTEGFKCLITSLMQEITDFGGKIAFSETVTEILKRPDGKFETVCVLNNSVTHSIVSDFVVFTGSCRTFSNVSHGLPIDMDTRDSIMNISYSACITVMLMLKKRHSEVYFQSMNIPEDFPFSRIVNHSNCFGLRGYGGSIVYLTGDCQVSDDIWIEDDAAIMELYFKGFRKLYSGIRRSDIKAWRVTKTRYANFGQYPARDLSNPCDNVYVCAAALTKYATHEAPASRMNAVVSLASSIAAQIKEKAGEDSKSTVTPIVTDKTDAQKEVR